MTRKTLNALVLLAGFLALGACDKCGGIQDLNVPGHSNVCHDSAPRK